MRVSLVFATLLCFTTWMSSVHAYYPSCCIRSTNTQIPIDRIADYTIQNGYPCPIRVIVFRTMKGKHICADPDSGWAKLAKLKVDETQYRQQRLLTTTGRTICSDQNGDCAKEDVLNVDEEDRYNTLQENGQNDEGATSDITPATATTSTYTPQRENGQNDEGATSDITPATATTSEPHLTEKPRVQRENETKTWYPSNPNTYYSYYRAGCTRNCGAAMVPQPPHPEHSEEHDYVHV